jgi:hypothetical protein
MMAGALNSLMFPTLKSPSRKAPKKQFDIMLWQELPIRAESDRRLGPWC